VTELQAQNVSQQPATSTTLALRVCGQVFLVAKPTLPAAMRPWHQPRMSLFVAVAALALWHPTAAGSGSVGFPPFGAAARDVVVSATEATVFSYSLPNTTAPPCSGRITTVFVESGELLWTAYDALRLRVYTDGEAAPSVDAPLGFFDMGDMSPWGTALIGNTGFTGATYLRLPVSFAASVRVTLVQGAGDVGRHRVHVLVSGSVVPGPATARTIAQAVSLIGGGSGGPAVLFSYIAPPTQTVRPLLVGISASAANASFYGGGGAVSACVDGGACVPLSYSIESFLLAETGFGYSKYVTPVAGVTAKGVLGQSLLGWRRLDEWPWGGNVSIVWDVPTGAGAVKISATTWAEVGSPIQL